MTTDEFEKAIRDELIYCQKIGVSADVTALRCWKVLQNFIANALASGRTIGVRGVFSIETYIRKASVYKDMATGRPVKVPKRPMLRLVVPYAFKQLIR